MGTDDAVVRPVLARVDPARRPAALSLLLTGQWQHNHPAVEQFMHFARSHDMTLERFWTVCEHPDDDAPQAAALIVTAAGRAGMMFLSPLLRDATVPLATALVRHAIRTDHVHDLALLQTLLEPHQQREQQAYTQAGFELLANLLYMRRRVERHVTPSALPDGLRLLPWSEARRPMFAEAILASYQDTLDCPGLLGMRHIDDIIAGHMSAGVFDPALWHVLEDAGQPVGVMLLSLHATGQTMELVYLGLTPTRRGQGLARTLLHHALALAATHRAQEIVLAVDENNTPALALYRALRFIPTARKMALVRAVTPA